MNDIYSVLNNWGADCAALHDDLENNYTKKKQMIDIESKVADNSETLGYVKSKNLFDYNRIVDGKALKGETKPGTTMDHSEWWLSYYVSVEPNTIYTLSGTSSVYTEQYDENYQFIEGTGVRNYTINTVANAKYIRFNSNKNGFTADSVMLNEGTTALPYEPYKGSVDERLESVEEAKTLLLYPGAGAHNAIYRGKYLGTAVTTEQYAVISAGTFEDLYIGDYWTIDGVNWRIAAFDYYFNCGDTNTTKHHVVIVPDTCLYNTQMNTSDVSTGGYVGSEIYTANLEQAKTTIKAVFSGHVLSHRIYLTNATTNGYASDGAWFDSEVDLMNENMVYGSAIFRPQNSLGSTVPNSYTVEKSQLSLFQHEPSRIGNRKTWWLRDVVTASAFAFVGYDGRVYYGKPSIACGVRPAFCIS